MSSIQDLLYKGKDITVLLSGGASDNGGISNGNSSLSKLFSDSNQKLFERVSKPIEFDKKKTVVVDSLEEEVSLKKKKGRKEIREAAAATKLADSNSSSNNNSNSSNIEGGSDDATAEDVENDKQRKLSEKEARTLFVGNFPVSESIKTIKALFSEFGEIESVRFRSVPVQGTAVDQSGNQNLVKKVCVNSKKLGDQKQSCNAYIVFSEAVAVDKAIESALETGSKVVGGRHIRVDRSTPTLFDHSRSLFVGGLPYYTDEEELLQHFASVVPGGFDDIEGIRIVRDSESLVCKGIAYILFKDRDAVIKGLTLHKQLYKNKQELRVTSCGKRTKRTITGPDKTSTVMAVSLSNDKKGGAFKRKAENNDSYERRIKVKHEARKNRQAAEAQAGSSTGRAHGNAPSPAAGAGGKGGGGGNAIKPAISFLPKAGGKISQQSIEEDLKRRRINLKTGDKGTINTGGKKGDKSFKHLSGGVRRAIRAHDSNSKNGYKKGGGKANKNDD